MEKIKAFGALKAKAPLQAMSIERRETRPHDVVIDIHYCGVCHSDIHQTRDEWGGSIFPMVPGHEIVGIVESIGSEVIRFKTGDRVGVGCFIDSCRHCEACEQGLEQYCESGANSTYNSHEKDGSPSYGGYSSKIVVDDSFVLSIPDNIALDKAAPLLCAGITTYSPLRHWSVQKGQKVGVIGLGGLGHMAVKIAAAIGAKVTLLSRSAEKEEDAKRLGASQFILSTDPEQMKTQSNTFDLIISTVSGAINLTPYLELLKRDKTLVNLGAPEKDPTLSLFPLILKRRSIAGTLVGGIKETQEMLDFCSKHGISSDLELINIDKINEAYERVLRGEVRYRFVIDIKSLD